VAPDVSKVLIQSITMRSLKSIIFTNKKVLLDNNLSFSSKLFKAVGIFVSFCLGGVRK
jgi:hypothetical protein